MSVVVLSMVTATLPALAFDDVDDDNTFVNDIEWLEQTGITRGCNPPDNTLFCPDDEVTRGQMAAFLVRGLELTESGPSFDDTSGHTFETDISRLAAAGITRGCNPPDNTRFCPDDEVTRGQMAAFLVRALELTESGPSFEDTAGNTFENDISRLAAAGITRGCNPPDNTRFCPDDPVTREQMAAFLHRALEERVGTPDNGLIAFVSDRQGGDPDIFVMNPDGSGVTNLTPGSDAGDFDPAWSPDGSKIAFTSSRDGEQDIFVMNADGSNQVNLTPASDGRGEDPSFTPDGSKVVFSGFRDGRSSIFVIDADDGDNLDIYDALTESNPFYFNPQVSPDEELMGFTYSFLGEDWPMWTLAYPDPTDDHPNAGEVVPEPLLTGPKIFEDFSPDGETILFSALSQNDDTFDIFAIDVADVGNTEPSWTNLTRNAALQDDGAEYSPDGSMIVYASWDADGPCCNQPSDIILITADGQFIGNLTDHPADDDGPAWQPVP